MFMALGTLGGKTAQKCFIYNKQIKCMFSYACVTEELLITCRKKKVYALCKLFTL